MNKERFVFETNSMSVRDWQGTVENTENEALFLDLYITLYKPRHSTCGTLQTSSQQPINYILKFLIHCNCIEHTELIWWQIEA